MGHENAQFDLDREHYKFDGAIKTMSIVFIVLGLIGAVWAFVDNGGWNHNSRFWSNFLLNSYYFNGMAITAIFFIAAHTIGYGSWIFSMRRVFESFSSFIIVGFVCFLIIILGLVFDWHSLYHHWIHPEVDDTIVGGKKSFLNVGSYTFFTILFFAGWILFSQWIRKHSLSSDHSVDDVAYNQKAKYISAGYIVVFGVGSSVFSWLAVMSLDPHWYSTLFGWYNFASYMCGFLCMIIIVITILRARRLLIFVNESHMHNINMFLFGFSVFWTYLWFSQFMLQWYGNIPEDTMWFVKRFDVPMFKVLFWVAFILNFVFPFLFLMKRSAKRKPWIYTIAAVIILFGHYLDFYSMIMFEPNRPVHHSSEQSNHHAQSLTLKSYLLAENESHSVDAEEIILDHTKDESKHTHTDLEPGHEEHQNSHEYHHKESHHASFGLIEIMMFLGFLGLFLFTVLTTLSKNRLVPLKSPYLKESLNYHW